MKPGGGERNLAAERGADQNGLPAELRDDGGQIRDLSAITIVAIPRAVAVAMAANVERDRAAAAGRDGPRAAAPAMPRLAEASEQQHRRASLGGAGRRMVGRRQSHAVRAVEPDGLVCHGGHHLDPGFGQQASRLRSTLTSASGCSSMMWCPAPGMIGMGVVAG